MDIAAYTDTETIECYYNREWCKTPPLRLTSHKQDPVEQFYEMEDQRKAAGWILTPYLVLDDFDAHYFCPNCVRQRAGDLEPNEYV